MVLGDDQEASEAQVERMGPGDVVVVLTHNREIDAPILAAAFRRNVGYIGGLGSRRTQEGRRRRLLAQELSEDTLTRYRGPVGLNLGGGTPAEIAVSVCAEVLAVLRRRDGRPLTDGDGSINA